MRTLLLASALLALTGSTMASPAPDPSWPHLETRSGMRQLVVDGQPFLILGGELLNSSPSSRAYLQPIWERLVAMHLNTVLVGVSWELIEPEEGRFDFDLVDGLIQDARAHHLRLVLLWFASWKNGMSSYVPVWVKRDPHRFPRVRLGNGESPEVVSPLALATADADARAFGALMQHLREIDSRDHTVLMVQVENEAGILGDARDRSPAAEAAFAGPVPAEWFGYARAHAADLVPELRAQWEAAGAKTSGTWTEVFGPGAATDELFMAWHYARYVDRVAAAGQAAYPIPLYANAWLNEKGAKPGDYPSGGPLAHLLNVWQAAAPHLSLIAPDLYAADFDERCRMFTRSGNPLFIPETNRGAQAGPHLFVAVGVHHAIGFSPFAIDSPLGGEGSTLEKSYEVMGQVAPIVLQQPGADRVVGFALDKEHPSFVTNLGGAAVEISLDEIFGRRAEKGYGIVVAVGPDEFIGAGTGFRVIFRPANPGSGGVGIAAVDEGVYRDGQWITGRRLNGDEDDQGRAWRFNPSAVQIERCTTYHY